MRPFFLSLANVSTEEQIVDATYFVAVNSTIADLCIGYLD
jgi:hypothetical protein